MGLTLVMLGRVRDVGAVLLPGMPVWVAFLAWSIAGLGMGLAYVPISLMMLREAPAGREGWASASLNLSDVLGTAIGIGTGGAAVAAATGPGLRWGITAAFGLSAAVAVAALGVTRRLPAGLTGRPVSRPD